jgi:hypothetical protein
MLKDYAESVLGYFLRHVEKSAPPKSSAAMQRGTLLHLLAEHYPNPVDHLVAIAPESVLTATGQFGKAAQQWLADEVGDRVPTSADELASVKRQFGGLLRNPAAKTLLETSIDREFVLRWEWEGHPMRCRCDGATTEAIYDLKTTSDFAPLKTFGSSVKKFGYDLQAAVYGEAGVAAGMPPHRLRFIVTSNVFPHHCHVVRLPPDTIQRAKARALRYLHEIRQRMDWGHWLPDDYGEVTDLVVSNWRD